MSATAATIPSAPAEPLRRRLLRSLLYGRNSNRAAKARARVGLAILAFAVVYAIIAVRLVMFAAVSDSRVAHRVVSGDAVATARPDILDRNGEVLATDVRAPSLFAEPRRIIDVDEAVELLTAELPDLDATELRERLASKRGFVWLKREITPKQQQEIHRLGLPGIGFLSENKRVYPNGPEVSHLLGHVNIDNQGIAGIEKWLDDHGPRRAAHGRPRHRPAAEAGRARGRSARAARAARRAGRRAREIQGAGRRRPRARRAHRRDRRHGVGAGLRPEQSAPGHRSDPHQPPDHRRLRDGLDLQGAHARHGARFRQGDRSIPRSMRACRCATASSTSTTSTPSTACSPCRRSSPIRRTSAPRAWRCRSASRATRRSCRKIGQLDRLRTELPESAEPIVPKRWGELNTITIAFGHGLSVAPLQAVMGSAR